MGVWNGPESKLWKAAMEEEMASMNTNNVWSLVECPKNKKPIRCKWIFKKKTGPDGSVCSYKARLDAQGMLKSLELIMMKLSVLYAKYKMKDLGKLYIFLGVRVMQTKNEVFLEQSAYTKALLSRFGMDNANSVATLVDVNTDLVTTSDEVEECDKDLYQSVVGRPMVVNKDNQSTICLAQNPKCHGRSKHIGIKFHYVRDLVRNKEIVLVYCPSNDMLADIFTKGLSAEKFSGLRRKLGVVFFEKHIQCEKEC
ncbi:Reverse transcriptase RNA-dependent DNA polymerase [Trinorchestia longiramus]|nr:Reverse transcriptase RNA-dependent DNA polymerase [Trinorchestia longiramus]